jgi:hypothetical protein
LAGIEPTPTGLANVIQLQLKGVALARNDQKIFDSLFWAARNEIPVQAAKQPSMFFILRPVVATNTSVQHWVQVHAPASRHSHHGWKRIHGDSTMHRGPVNSGHNLGGLLLM